MIRRPIAIQFVTMSASTVKPTNACAIVGLVFTLLLLPVIGLTFGLIAQEQISREPDQHGSAIASAAVWISGLIIGVVVVCAALILGVSIATR